MEWLQIRRHGFNNYFRAGMINAPTSILVPISQIWAHGFNRSIQS